MERLLPLPEEIARSRKLDAEDARFATLWDGASAHQRLVLSALAVEPGWAHSESYRMRHTPGPSSSVSRSLSRLVEQDLVEHSPRDGYRVPEAFFREWVRRLRRPPELMQRLSDSKRR
jgi:hypothetical protein